jgi:hypothetical protein
MLGASGSAFRAHCGGDAERTELAVADKADRARQVVEGRLRSAAQGIGIGAAVRPAIGNIVQWDVCYQLEHFHRHVRRGAVTRRGVIKLAGIGFGVGVHKDTAEQDELPRPGTVCKIWPITGNEFSSHANDEGQQLLWLRRNSPLNKGGTQAPLMSALCHKRTSGWLVSGHYPEVSLWAL